MTTETEPIIGQWYYHLDKGQKFTVVAIDEDSGLIELQHFDGDVEEVSLEDWSALDIELSEAPENWTGPIDIGEVDDLGTDITETSRDEWSQPLQELRKAGEEKLVKEEEEIGEEFTAEELIELSHEEER